jgi:uridine kinase
MHIIAIAGHSGSGKSTLVKNLSERLGDAITLGIDSYDSNFYPRAVEWIERGADPNEFQTPHFFADVRALKEGQTIIHPETKDEIKPTNYLIIEEPFGKGRDALRPLIDLAVFLDTPLEVAYARKLLRKTDFLPWEDNPSVFIQHLRENLEWYLRVGRRFYQAVEGSARKDCDLIVDGLLPSEKIVEQVHNFLKKRFEGETGY